MPERSMGRGDVAAGHLNQFIGAAFADADTRFDECGPPQCRAPLSIPHGVLCLEQRELVAGLDVEAFSVLVRAARAVGALDQIS